MTRLTEMLADAVGETTPMFSFDDVVARAAARRTRQRIGTAIVVAVFVSALIVSVALSLSHKTAGPGVTVSPTTNVTTANAWCVPVSRTDAVERVMLLRAEVPRSAYPAGAKLISRSELDTFSTGTATAPPRGGSRFWIVEIIGPVHPAFAEGRSFGWGLFEVDANSGQVAGVMAGPEASPPFWHGVPDHAQDCAASPTPPWVNATSDTYRLPCSVPKGQTVTAWDHATNRPVEVNREYYCERARELQPPVSAHLDGSIYIANGRVVATYYRLTEVTSVNAQGLRVGTAVDSKDPVPIDQLPASIQRALGESTTP